MLKTHAVGIDLGTTYSCIAYLNEHGEPVTLPNQEGELSTPSVVLFEDNEVIVGTEALRNAILSPDRVVQNSKRYIGDPDHCWMIDQKPYTPIDIAAFILKKLISAAQEQIGSIDQAVITVPAQFSDYQRQATVAAGHRAGLTRVDIINEPVAAALCYVLGTEGLWFTELAGEQRIMVYDLGGGTFDLSLVKYQKNEVSVVAAAGDLNLGGIDWNRALEGAVAKQFKKQFGVDPREDPESRQFLALEAEQTKRSLSVRPRAAMTVQHAGHRTTYQIEQSQFEKLTAPLVERTAQITQKMLKDRKMGWAHVDVVLTTGGASRMPMIRNRLKKLSGTTLNTSLSPDQSIAHGATYYAGMLISNEKFARSILSPEASQRLSQFRQRSVTARGLGIMVRDPRTDQRIPHYLIKAGTLLPVEATETFGTVIPNQRRVHLQIVESGLNPDQPPVKLGACVIENLPPNLPEGSEIAVTIRYDEQALVHVDAKDVSSGTQASTEIVRHENLKPQLESPPGPESDVAALLDQPAAATVETGPSAKQSTVSSGANVPVLTSAGSPDRAESDPVSIRSAADSLEEAAEPIPLCNSCGEPLDVRGNCPRCGKSGKPQAKPQPKRRPTSPTVQPKKAATSASPVRPKPKVVPVPQPRPGEHRKPSVPAPPDPDEIIELGQSAVVEPPQPKARPTGRRRPSQGSRRSAESQRSAEGPDLGEEDFWRLTQ